MTILSNSCWDEVTICEGCKKAYRNIYKHQQECMMYHMVKVLQTKNKRKKK